MIIVGVAGHIDHGKSSLVRRLTGIDPDRLPEEKERGMTIDLGFAHWSGPAVSRGAEPVVAFVDVPGHERFVRNMIAGVGGISAIILVVAADDGWMPQTQEHLDIVRLLGVARGIVVVSKIDSAPPERQRAVVDDIRHRLADTFLALAPIIQISSITGEGYPVLENALVELEQATRNEADIAKPRLWIDRSFILPGIGAVVTGSTRDGGLRVGQEIVVYPGGQRGKIRSLERHSQQVTAIGSGERAAVTISGVSKEALARGAVVSVPELVPTSIGSAWLFVRVRALENAPFPLKNRRRALFFHGTSEIPCEIRLFGDAPITPGGEGLCAFRMEYEPLCFVGDPFVLRLPTPAVTIGGGEIIGWGSAWPNAQYQSALMEYADHKSPTINDTITLETARIPLTARKSFMRRTRFAAPTIEKALTNAKIQNELGEIGGRVFRDAIVTEIIQLTVAGVRTKLTAEPHLVGLTPHEAQAQSPEMGGLSATEFADILALAEGKGLLVKTEGRYRLPDASMGVSGEVKKEADRIMRLIDADPLNPPLIPELVKPGKAAREALGYFLSSRKIVKCGTEVVITRALWIVSLRTIANLVTQPGGLTVSAFRAAIGVSRKYAVPILEETDRRRVTRREGDFRVAGSALNEALSDAGK